MFSCESKQLAQEFEAFCVEATSRLENQRYKLVGGALEILVIPVVLLPNGIALARLLAR